jgi:hypothetical protein
VPRADTPRFFANYRHGSGWWRSPRCREPFGTQA